MSQRFGNVDMCEASGSTRSKYSTRALYSYGFLRRLLYDHVFHNKNFFFFLPSVRFKTKYVRTRCHDIFYSDEKESGGRLPYRMSPEV